jgi:hypothetical protein
MTDGWFLVFLFACYSRVLVYLLSSFLSSFCIPSPTVLNPLLSSSRSLFQAPRQTPPHRNEEKRHQTPETRPCCGCSGFDTLCHNYESVRSPATNVELALSTSLSLCASGESDAIGVASCWVRCRSRCGSGQRRLPGYVR